MHRETLLPQPVLFNAALYAVVALVYSLAFFIIDNANPGKHVFDKQSDLREKFSLLAICSWPLLLFGAFILLAVRVGANVRRRRRRRRRRNQIQSTLSSFKRSKSATRISRSRSQMDRDPSSTRRSSSAPPALPRPPSTKPPALAAPTTPPSSSHPTFSTPSQPRRVQSDHVALPDQSLLPVQARQHSTVNRQYSTTPLPNTSNLEKSRNLSKRSNKSTSSQVPRGFVSVTRGQKAFSAIGFLLIAVGLFATSAVAALVFQGQRERYFILLNDLGYQHDGAKEWAIAIATGGVFAVLFAVLGISACIKFFKAVRPTPSSLEMRTVALGPDAELDALEGAWSRNNSQPNDLYSTTLRRKYVDESGDDDDFVERGGRGMDGSESETDDVDQGSDVESVGTAGDGMGIVRVVSTNAEGTGNGAGGDWRQVYEMGSFLPYQPDQATVERMMRQLRDMGFSNPFQNIAALQASSFDLEIASDKLDNAQVKRMQGLSSTDLLPV